MRYCSTKFNHIIVQSESYEYKLIGFTVWTFMCPVFQMDTDGTFHQKILVEKLQGFPNDTIIPDLEEIVDHCVTKHEGRYK
jgi:hypothetical protein